MFKRNWTTTFLLMIFCSVFFFSAQAQDQKKESYGFKINKEVKCTPVKSQDRTGTCWSFATASFLESELMRMGKGQHDLSEMFVVQNIYKDKARNYILRQGKANFSQGSLSHDLIRVASVHGVMPESVFSGKLDGEQKHDHSEMEAAMKGMLDGLLKQKRLSKKWQPALSCVLDTYIGQAPENFSYQGKNYTPKSLADELAINPNDYINLTSFTHHPFYKQFILEIPDNYSNGAYYNIPLNELQAIVDNALDQGYSLAWDGDVSEKGFNAKQGIAVVPTDAKRDDLFQKPGKEMKVTTELRQDNFESYATTDDHLMHLVGTSTDKAGNKYYLIKNSWGEISEYKGFLHMSEAYFQLKTVSIMVHKNAIPANIAQKIL